MSDRLHIGRIFLMIVDDDRVFDPMIYDAMREFATRISGQYVAWKREAKTTEEAEHWQREMLRFNAEVRAVNHRSKSAIEAKRAELRELWASLPVDAPKFAAWNAKSRHETADLDYRRSVQNR